MRFSFRFSKSSYKGILHENAQIGTKVLRVSAYDADERDNGKVFFEIDDNYFNGNGQGAAFIIDRVSGDIRSNITLDREAKAFYEFHVLARDGGKPENTAQALVRIDILDVNDNPPKFIKVIKRNTIIILNDY